MALRVSALCLLVALAAPVAARADSPPQPVPADGQCTVPADPAWTKQEQFVWLKVCAGQEADFNKEPDYGGNLDPKGAAGLPASRVLRSSFLETILLKDAYRHALTRRGVRIIGARFTELVDLSNAEIGHDLWLDQCLLERGAYLEAAKPNGLTSFDGSTIVGGFSAPGMQTGADLSMNRTEILGNMNLLRAHIGGTLYLAGANVIGMLRMNGIRVDQSVFMRDKARLKDVDLGGAHIGINLELDSSTVTGLLFMNGIRVDQDLFIRNAQFKDINLSGAHIGGQADLSGTTVAGTLNMNAVRIDGSLIMRDKAQFKEIDLIGAHIGGSINLSSATVAGTLNLFWSHIDGSLDLSGAMVTGNLTGPYADIGQSLTLGYGARFAEEIDLPAARIGQDLVLLRGSFDKAVQLNVARIGGNLWLGAVQWAKGSSLNLTNSSAGTIDLSENWPAEIQANGFTYRNLSNRSKYDSRQANAWLDRQAYASQPYEQLATVLQANGLTDEATDIRYAGRDREWREASGLKRVWLSLLKYSIGFGYHLEYAFAWALGFVLLGWAVLYASGQRSKHGTTLGLVYSFDMLLPLVQLDKAHEDIALDPWPRRYFYVHKLVGVLLASFIAAGISGLTK